MSTASGSGISIGEYGFSTAFISNTTINGRTRGIRVMRQSIVTVYSSTISNCTTSAVAVGVNGDGSTGIVLTQNITFSGNTVNMQVAYGGQILNNRNDFAG